MALRTALVTAGIAAALAPALSFAGWEVTTHGRTVPLWYEYRASVNDAGTVAGTSLTQAGATYTMTASVQPLSGAAQPLSTGVAGETEYTQGYAFDISADDHVVGFRSTASNAERRALRWVRQGASWAVDDLHARVVAASGFADFTISAAYGVSESVANMRYAVGYARKRIEPQSLSLPIVWEIGATSTTVRALPLNGATYGIAYGVSEPTATGARYACGGVGPTSAFMQATCWDLTAPGGPQMVVTPSAIQLGSNVKTSVVNRVRRVNLGTASAPDWRTYAVGYYVQDANAVIGFVWELGTGVVDIHTAYAANQDAILSDVAAQAFSADATRANPASPSLANPLVRGPMIVGTGTTTGRVGAEPDPMALAGPQRAIAQTRIAQSVAAANAAPTCNMDAVVGELADAFAMVSGISPNGLNYVGYSAGGELLRARDVRLAAAPSLYARNARVYSSQTAFTDVAYHWIDAPGSPDYDYVAGSAAGCSLLDGPSGCLSKLSSESSGDLRSRIPGLQPNHSYVQLWNAAGGVCDTSSVYALPDLVAARALNPAADTTSASEEWATCGPTAAPESRPNTGGHNVDLQNDWYHCGSCSNSCYLGPGSITRCQSGGCLFDGCVPGYVDLDGLPTNGCECPIQNGGVDNPELTAPFVDQNCDGIDGDIAQSVFVAKWGADGGSCGTMSAPCLTVQAGVNRASALGRGFVLVGAGTYTELVTLSNGVSVYGAYAPLESQNWQRDVSYTTTIAGIVSDLGDGEAIVGTGISSTTYVNLVTVLAPNATMAGRSSYGVRCTNCGGLRVAYATIEAGNGMQGVAGSAGAANNAHGGGGGGGGGGSDDGSGSPGNVGGGGSSSCSRAGGPGGAGGARGRNAGSAGVRGWLQIASGGGGAGGAGGARHSDCGHNDGRGGGGGAGGVSGTAGSAGSSGSVSGGLWAGAVGGAGGTSSAGHGGGGGGGGSGQRNNQWAWDGCLAIGGAGNSGGGGGGGGCAGSSGQGGSAGGGSFGVLLSASAGAQVTNTRIVTGNGAGGGRGGDGGRGSNGGNGGNGGDSTDGDEIGWGGGGGGGGGGAGGAGGGGGAGGPSVGVAFTGGAVTTSGLLVSLGVAGAGGAGGTGGGGGSRGNFGPNNKSSGLNGADGVAGANGNTGIAGATGARAETWSF